MDIRAEPRLLREGPDRDAVGAVMPQAPQLEELPYWEPGRGQRELVRAIVRR